MSTLLDKARKNKFIESLLDHPEAVMSKSVAQETEQVFESAARAYEALEQTLHTSEGAKIQYGKNVVSNKAIPNNFSVTLGAAPCNHSCLFCPQSVEKPDGQYWLDLELLRKVLHEMPEEGVLLNVSAYTETIVAPNLIDAIKMMKEIRPKLKVAMATNGTLFREEKVEELIDVGLDQYSYSFDSPNPQDYATIMQKDDFHKVWNNLEQIVAMRDKKRSSMIVTTHIMHFKGVEQDFEVFKNYWQDKVDAVVLRRVGNWGSDDLGLMNRLKEEGFESAHETPTDRYPCMSIFTHFKLQYTGEYYPCVSAIPAYDKHLVPPIGHAKDITFLEAWERLGEMRRAHLEGRWDDYECCKTCNIWSLWDNPWFRETNLDNTKTDFYLKDTEYAQ
ncbi:MAG: radical SAM/SPASM domain-containing protein [Cyanobacteria bacterium HKST-UBA06]|nr:radical SAM/SPASM domain-containing protein [Cyanobacteria bacterium HKST-UBA05]MCA9807152.1 radical SAM/SPASM domain-containing protein [Cyanobacteria bacterium HKST-UBA06]MCA9842214.1 radical SAM/SPASM domain-containing protein [Cyanobacteria bacterium HKST-UBA03]